MLLLTLLEIVIGLLLAGIAIVLFACVCCLVIAMPFLFKFVKENMLEWLEDL